MEPHFSQTLPPDSNRKTTLSRLLEQRRAKSALPRWLIQSPLHYLFPFRLAGFDEVLTDGALSPSRTPRETPALHPCASACSTPSSALPKSTATGTN